MATSLKTLISKLLDECGWGLPSDTDSQETSHMNTSAEPAYPTLGLILSHIHTIKKILLALPTENQPKKINVYLDISF